jgi:hypothetical protein
MSDSQNPSSKDSYLHRKRVLRTVLKKCDTENYVVCAPLLLRISITPLGGRLEFCIVYINSGTLVMGIAKI